MSQRGARALRNSKGFFWAAQQRRDGREDAWAGRPAMLENDDYMRGYREGSTPCRCANSTAHSEGCQRTPARGKVRLCTHCAGGHND